MSEISEEPSVGSAGEQQEDRCPSCDSVISPQEERCLMCGADLSEGRYASSSNLDQLEATENRTASDNRPVMAAELVPDVQLDAPTAKEVVESVMVEKRPSFILWLGTIIFILIAIFFVTILRFPDSATLAFIPTLTQFPSTFTFTPTWTPLPTETQPPSQTPTITSTPLPTDTPKPPRTHSVLSGDTLFGLSLRYGVSVDSITDANAIPQGGGIQVSQDLIIPWPTPTPPLSPVEIDVGSETIIADPTDCEMYEIKGGDSFFAISARLKVDLRALMAVNRLTEQSILQPGDSICIPEIIRGGVLPPTPGPSPTATPTRVPPGPQLLYPPPGTEVTAVDETVTLQWAAVKDLGEDEWYMVELTNLGQADSHPIRAFVRQNSYQIPNSWRPSDENFHDFRWRVSIIVVTGKREDGSFIYTFGGENSQDANFRWLGVVPSPTPTMTPVETPSATN